MLSAILCSIHNVHFYEQLMAQAREAILADRYAEFEAAFMREYGAEGQGADKAAKRGTSRAASGATEGGSKGGARRPRKKRSPRA